MTTTDNQYTVLYFAALAETTGKASETLSSGTYPDLAALYTALNEQYHFPLAQDQLRVARNQQFCAWTDAPQTGDEIAFIPPVSGG